MLADDETHITTWLAQSRVRYLGSTIPRIERLFPWPDTIKLALQQIIEREGPRGAANKDQQHGGPLNVRPLPFADIAPRPRHVRFTPESGHHCLVE
jgi:hypothetical protein